VVNSFRITVLVVINFAPCKPGLPFDWIFEKLIPKNATIPAMIARETKTPTSFKLIRCEFFNSVLLLILFMID